MGEVRCAERAGDQSVPEFAAGGRDECFDGPFAAVGDRNRNVFGGGTNATDATLERFGDGDRRNAAFIGVGGYDDTHDTPNERNRVGVCYLA